MIDKSITTIETRDDGRFVINNCSIRSESSEKRTLEVALRKFETLGCVVQFAWTPGPNPIFPKLNFQVTLPAGTVRGTGIRFDDIPLDIFIAGESFFFILRPDERRQCRTLMVEKKDKLKIDKFCKSLSPELTTLIQAEAT